MKVISCLLLMLVFTGCGMPLGKKDGLVRVEGVTTKRHSTTDPRFSTYIQKFEDKAASETSTSDFKVGDVPVNFGDTTKPNYDGVCLLYPDGTKEVIIKKSWWKSANKVSKKIMIFHELGHCRLGRKHDSSTVEIDGRQVKTSIMHPVIPDYATFGTYQEGYLNELFTENKDQLLQSLGAEGS